MNVTCKRVQGSQLNEGQRESFVKEFYNTCDDRLEEAESKSGGPRWGHPWEWHGEIELSETVELMAQKFWTKHEKAIVALLNGEKQIEEEENEPRDYWDY